MSYIYALTDPRTDVIRYVGKADNPARRLKRHLSGRELRRRGRRTAWLRGLLTAGHQPLLAILEDVGTGDWQEAERWWIAHLRSIGTPLTNETDGGEGLHDSTGEVGAKISAAVRDRPAWNRGRKWEPGDPHYQQLARAREANTKLPYWATHSMTSEHRARIGAARRGKPGYHRPFAPAERDAYSMDWIVTTPTGEEIHVRNLKQWCRERGLHDSLLHHTATGKRNHHRGYRARRAT